MSTGLILALAAVASGAAAVVDGTSVAVSVSGPASASSVELRIADAIDKHPIVNAEPLGWITPDDASLSCPAMIARAQKASLGSSVINLNSLRIAAAFADGSLALLDPQTSFGGTQLESAVDLGSAARTLAVDPANGGIAAITADAKLMLVDTTASARIAATQPVAADAALVWSEGRFWSASGKGLDARDPLTLLSQSHIEWPLSGTPILRASDGGLLIGSTLGPTGMLLPGAKIPVRTGLPNGLRDGAYMSKASAWLIAGSDGTLTLVSRSRRVAIPGISGARGVAVDRDGRFALVITDEGRALSLVDGADLRVLDTRPLPEPADRLTLSRDFAYVHSSSSQAVQLISFDVMRQQQRIATVDLPFGEAPHAPATPLFSRVAVMPGGAAVIGNDGKTLYAYAEGMMVPMGSFAGITRQLAGIAPIDRSLREVSPGVYRTTATIRYGGRYRVPVRIANPRVDTCLTVDVDGPARPAMVHAVRAQFDAIGHPLAPGQTFTVRLSAPARGTQVQALATDMLGRWQRHFLLVRSSDGRFAGQVRFPEAGQYRLIALDARASVVVDAVKVAAQ